MEHEESFSVRQVALVLGSSATVMTTWFIIIDPLVRGVVGEVAYPYNYLAVLGLTWVLVGIGYALSRATDGGSGPKGGIREPEEDESSTGGVK